jgi:outer membrane receptor protein involved in Fe transport
LHFLGGVSRNPLNIGFEGEVTENSPGNLNRPSLDWFVEYGAVLIVSVDDPTLGRQAADTNNLIAGVAYEEAKTYPSERASNWATAPGGYILFPSVQDAPDHMKWSEWKRDFKAIYAEDIWDMTEDLRLTIGGRYDYYSDFGGQFSPRAGLNWGFATIT